MDDAREYTMRLCKVLNNRMGLTEEECKYIAGAISQDEYFNWWNSLSNYEKSHLQTKFARRGPNKK